MGTRTTASRSSPPEIGEQARPGQFVSIRLREDSAQILRRPFSVYRMHKRGGWASTIEIVFDIRGAGTRYLSQLRAHSTIDIVGPTGRGFVMPKRRAHCLLVGGGIGAAPLFFLADELRNEGHRVDFVMGARTSGLLLNPIDVRRLASVYRMTTEDGSQGDRGRRDRRPGGDHGEVWHRGGLCLRTASDACSRLRNLR